MNTTISRLPLPLRIFALLYLIALVWLWGPRVYWYLTSIHPSGDTSGVTDTRVVGAAIEKAAAGGGVVKLGRGTFYVDSALTIPDDARVEGAHD